MNFFNKTDTAKYRGAGDCGSTAVTDKLFMQSALPPAAKTH